MPLPEVSAHSCIKSESVPCPNVLEIGITTRLAAPKLSGKKGRNTECGELPDRPGHHKRVDGNNVGKIERLTAQDQVDLV